MDNNLLAVIFVLVLVGVIFLLIRKEKTDKEKSITQRNIETMSLEIDRLKAQTNGRCPKCNREKQGNVCECGFEFIDGAYCDNCGTFTPLEQITSRHDIDLNWISECEKCKGKLLRKY